MVSSSSAGVTASATSSNVIRLDAAATSGTHFPTAPWWTAFSYVRNPDPGVLRGWAEDDLGWSRRRVHRTRLGDLRRAWRNYAWNPPQPRTSFLRRFLDEISVYGECDRKSGNRL